MQNISSYCLTCTAASYPWPRSYLKAVNLVRLSGWLSPGLLKITFAVVLCLTWDSPDHMHPISVSSVITAASLHRGHDYRFDYCDLLLLWHLFAMHGKGLALWNWSINIISSSFGVTHTCCIWKGVRHRFYMPL